MLKVTIELFPYGDEKNAKVLRTVYIANDGKGTSEKGNYVFREFPIDPWLPSVQNWPRRTPVEQLVRAVIEKHYG
jgi:hypothetical protein